MAKLARERRVLEKRQRKQEKKQAAAAAKLAGEGGGDVQDVDPTQPPSEERAS